jgi:hypothetical protein
MNLLFTACATVAVLATAAGAATFYPISAVTSSTAASDLFPASNLIQGPGVGYDSLEPHSQLGAGATHRWVTAAPGGFPSDYIAVAGAPVITFDLGTNVALNEISVWGYSATNANGLSAFGLRFATEADGIGGFGNSITYNPAFGGPPGGGGIPNDDVSRMSFAFTQTVSARYVQMTITDNYYSNGGSGPPPGGDRVGMGEVAFAVIPEPASGLLGGLALLGLARRRRH